MSFYMYLPSNSSVEYFPSNTISRFRTKLSKRIQLSEEFEVALTEFSYFGASKTFSDNAADEYERELIIQYKNVKPNQSLNANISVARKPLLMSNTAYISLADFVSHLNHLVKDYTEGISLWIDKITQKIKINCISGTSIQFSEKIAKGLGFQRRGFFGDGTHIADNTQYFYSGNYI
jgi:hypothetical protein